MEFKHFDELASATDKADLLRRLIKFTGFVDFERCAIIHQSRDVVTGRKWVLGVTDVPEAFESSHRDPKHWDSDPVLKHLRSSARPLVWTRENYVEAGLDGQWEEQATFGYAVGAVVSMNVPGGRLVFGVDRSGKLPGDPDKITRLVADMQLMLAYTHESLIKLLVDETSTTLTQQQALVLQLVAEGKSNPDIAQLLGISRNTVAWHLKAIFQRWGISSREQAVIEGCRRGLLH